MSVKLRALDSFYADDVKQVHGGAEFEVASDARADELVSKGRAERVDKTAAKAEKEAPANKMQAKPANKSTKAKAKAQRRKR